MWEMTLCTGPEADLIVETFDSPAQWRDWLRENHPRLMDEDRWNGEGEGWHQRGTDYYWSTIKRVL